MNGKNAWLKVAGIATAIVGGVVAVALLIKKKSERFQDEDYDESLYFDDDPSMMDEEYSDSYNPMEEAKAEESAAEDSAKPKEAPKTVDSAAETVKQAVTEDEE
jgi:hypothetical protein